MWRLDKTSADLSVQRWKGLWFICPYTVQSSPTSHSATSYHRRGDVSEPCESRGQGGIWERVLDEQSEMKNGVCVRCSEAVWAMRDGSEYCGCLWQGVHSPLLASSLAHKHVTTRPSPHTLTVMWVNGFLDYKVYLNESSPWARAVCQETCCPHTTLTHSHTLHTSLKHPTLYMPFSPPTHLNPRHPTHSICPQTPYT